MAHIRLNHGFSVNTIFFLICIWILQRRVLQVSYRQSGCSQDCQCVYFKIHAWHSVTAKRFLGSLRSLAWFELRNICHCAWLFFICQIYTNLVHTIPRIHRWVPSTFFYSHHFWQNKKCTQLSSCKFRKNENTIKDDVSGEGIMLRHNVNEVKGSQLEHVHVKYVSEKVKLLYAIYIFVRRCREA